ncbi:hypothetical protein MKS88_004165 [Plasmodium brasilianum]|uniref:Uncharacterized protein n=1 Tax=Plasmodium brasilianum TaxID=5824 RepID=A0ACB9Y4L2_PLABR|nr:hypothetical protein MKS88_004165 [Plasmodium brasilianum]
MKFLGPFHRRLTSQINSCGHIPNEFLVKLYLYNVSMINIDVYYNLISSLNSSSEKCNDNTHILNNPYFKDGNLVLYKYIQILNKQNEKKKLVKLLKLLILLYSRNLREYNDKNNYFYNSSVDVHNFVLQKFFHFQSNAYLTKKENKKNEKGVSIINKYSLYTDFFLYSLDFYLYHLSNNYNILNIEQLNVLANIYANINISTVCSSPPYLECNEKYYGINNSLSLSKGIEGNGNHRNVNDIKFAYETFEHTSLKISGGTEHNNKLLTFENNVNNKICLLYIYISKCLIDQIYAHIMNKRYKYEKKVSLKTLISNNVNTCENILKRLLKKSTYEQFKEYTILKKKYDYKLLSLNVLKNYFNSIKYLNIINIKKYFYILSYLYFSTFLFTRSIYYSSLFFYLLQKYNLQYTYIFNILLIKFNLFFLNYKIMNDYNGQIIFDSISKYIDTLLIFQIKQNERGNRKNSALTSSNNDEERKKCMANFPSSHDFYINIYKKEYSKNEIIHKILYNEVYDCHKVYMPFLTYFEHSLFNLFKYLYYKIPWFERNKNKTEMNTNSVEKTSHKFKCFINKKYNNKYYLTMSENFLSNIILLSIYVQNCLPLLFSVMQKAEMLSTKRTRSTKINISAKRWARKNEDINLYKRISLIPVDRENSNPVKRRKNRSIFTQLFYARYVCNNFIYKKYINEKENNIVNPFVILLFTIYNIFREKIVNMHNVYEDINICNKYKKKNIEESKMYYNIKRNKNNKIQTSLTHYYISSNLKKINDTNLYNEKNILTFYCDIHFNNNIIEVDGPKHFLMYYDYYVQNFSENYFTNFILKNKYIFDNNYLFPFFFNNISALKLKGNQNNKYYLYNDKSIKKNFFLYIYGYFIKHINYSEWDITSYKYLYDVLFKKKSELHVNSYIN